MNHIELNARTRALIASGNTFDSAARKLSAEFHLAAYVSNGALWASYRGDDGKPACRVLAY